MADTPTAKDLAARAARLIGAQRALREHMAQVAAEIAGKPPQPQEVKPT